MRLLQRRIRREKFEQMYELYMEGKTLTEIGNVFGISKQRVNQILRAAASDEEYSVIKRESERRRSSTWQDCEVINLLEAGKTCTQVSKLLNVSLSFVKRASARRNRLKKLELSSSN
jgi:transposase-like protein